MSKINKQDVLKVLVTELSAYILYLILYPLGEFLRSVDNVYISYFSIMLINIFLFYILDYAVGIILAVIIKSKAALLYWLGGFILLGLCYLIYPSDPKIVFGWIFLHFVNQIISFLLVRSVKLISRRKKIKRSEIEPKK